MLYCVHMGYRLSEREKKALKTALTGFEGEVYLFGSRTDLQKRGGDIDILLKPKGKQDSLALKLSIARRFMQELEQSLDVFVYEDDNIFCKEIMKHAKSIDPKSL